MTEPNRNNGNKKQEKVEFREMDLDDLPQVFDIGEKLFTAKKWPTLYRTWDEYELLDLYGANKDLCLVAEINDRIVGFALGSIIEKERSSWIYGYLEWIGVLPEMMDKGIGTKLFNRLTDLFIKRGARMMIVDTEMENRDALQFFKKQGFGQETRHVFLTRNLSNHPDYIKRKASQKKSVTED